MSKSKKSIVGLQREQLAEMNKNFASGSISPEQHEKEYKKEMLKFKINNKQYECAQLQEHIEECKNRINCRKKETNSFEARKEVLINRISEKKHNISDYNENDYARYKEIFRAEHELDTVQKHITSNSDDLTFLMDKLEKYMECLAEVNKDIEQLESEIK